MNKKVLWVALILLVVLGVAAVLYPKLSANMLPRQMATTPPATTEATEPATTQPPTEAATEIPETTAATEPAEPKKFTAPNFFFLKHLSP